MWRPAISSGPALPLELSLRVIEAVMPAPVAFERLEHLRAAETEPLLEALDGLFREVTEQNQLLKELNANLEKQLTLRTR
jgi:hemerythrin